VLIRSLHSEHSYLLAFNCFRFQPDTQGILLSVSRCTVPKAGVIVGLSPFVHFSVTVQGLMYSPRVGGVVPLKLEFVSEGHLSGLVLGVFNASLPSDLLPTGSTFDASKEEWTVPDAADAPARTLVSAGSLVYMRISDLGVAGGAVSLTGTLLTSEETEAHKAKRNKATQKAATTPVRQGGVKRRLEDTPASEVEGGAASAKASKKSKTPAKNARKEKKARKDKV